MKSAIALLPLLGYGLAQEREFECDDLEVRLPQDAERYKQCSTRDHDVRVRGKKDDGDDVRIEGFPVLAGTVTLGSYTIKSLWCDATAIGDLEIYLSDKLESISFPNLTTIGSISIRDSDKLKSFHAPKLHTISRWLSLLNVPELTEFTVSSHPQRYQGYTLQVGYNPDRALPTGPFTGHRFYDLVGNVYLSNVSQSIADSLLNNATIALPAVEFHNSPAVTHLNYNASRTSNLTINGTGDTTVTLNAHRESHPVTVDKLLLSGVKEVKTDLSSHHRLPVNEVHIVDNPEMKEVVLTAFQTPNLLSIANNPVLESIRFIANDSFGFTYIDSLSITNNTNLRLSATNEQYPHDDSTYRSSDNTLARFPWNIVSSKLLQLEGYFDMDFFNLTDDDSYVYAYQGGNIIINSTAPDFKCSKVSIFKQKSSSGKPGSMFTCNGDISERVKSSASTLPFSKYYLFITLVYGLWSTM